MIQKSQAYAIVRKADKVVIEKGSKSDMLKRLKVLGYSDYQLYMTWYAVGQKVSY